MVLVNLKRSTEIARDKGLPYYKVDYAIKSRQIEPACRVGLTRLYDEHGVRQIEEALATTEKRSRK